MVIGTLEISLDRKSAVVSVAVSSIMPACESKLVSRNSRKAAVAKTVFVE